MFEDAKSKFYLPPEVDLKKKVMQIYDDKILITDRPDFSYDHVWKPFVIAGVGFLSLFLNDLMIYIQIALSLIIFLESIKEPDNRLTKIEFKFLLFQRLIAIGVLSLFGFNFFMGYVLLTEACFHLRLKFLKREEPDEFTRVNIYAITFNEGNIFRDPLITISYFDDRHLLKSASYTFANEAELNSGKIKLADTKVIL
ncbi:hypothetical protein G7074_04865 [Pedobacter sp. HDW13]|uniref:hypothetical protein n=1 Tax=unclassified Pedobacter TaxID=2628915 RepID=UPI000F5A1B65|nr:MULTISPECIES: hypothetical protein [unclassified Pedobacter]QIL38668.1 hypothetical protein G7074_04865 [Pedobacter sp. HDW13]RQO80169.1 hypothetical protein DBR40_00690 [Pedobacter sp. KBW01]